MRRCQATKVLVAMEGEGEERVRKAWGGVNIGQLGGVTRRGPSVAT